MFPSVPLGLQVEATCRSRQMPTHSRWDALLYERETQSSGSLPCHRKHNQVCVVPKGDLTSCLKLAHCLSEHRPEQRSGCKVMLPCVPGMLIKMHRGIGCLQKSVSPIISSYYSILLANRPLIPETVGKRKLCWIDSDASQPILPHLWGLWPEKSPTVSEVFIWFQILRNKCPRSQDLCYGHPGGKMAVLPSS